MRDTYAGMESISANAFDPCSSRGICNLFSQFHITPPRFLCSPQVWSPTIWASLLVPFDSPRSPPARPALVHSHTDFMPNLFFPISNLLCFHASALSSFRLPLCFVINIRQHPPP